MSEERRYSVVYEVRDESGDLQEEFQEVGCDEVIYSGPFVRFRSDGEDIWVLSASSLVEFEFYSEE